MVKIIPRNAFSVCFKSKGLGTFLPLNAFFSDGQIAGLSSTLGVTTSGIGFARCAELQVQLMAFLGLWAEYRTIVTVQLSTEKTCVSRPGDPGVGQMFEFHRCYTLSTEVNVVIDQSSL